MQITRNQHYVPRFYMKQFSNILNANTKKEKVLISFYQFKDGLLRDSVPTTSVCSEDYFYDEDGKVEGMLAEKEGKWASIIQQINLGVELNSNDIHGIQEFTIYQLLRTKASLEHSQNMASTMVTDVLYNEHPSLDKSVIRGLVEQTIEQKITSDLALEMIPDILPTLDDLKFTVLENNTSVPFFTSDSPVIIVNPLGIRRAGLSNIGTIVFFPLSRTKMAVFYDSKLYGDIVSEIDDVECVHSFNKYQYVCADERILALVSSEVQEYSQNPDLNIFREKFHEASKTSTIYDGEGTFIAAKSRAIEYYFEVSTFKLPRQLRKIPIDFRETFSRAYSYEARIAILCRVYRDTDFITDEDQKTHWKLTQKYLKILLNYLDSYWHTPRADRLITGNLMHKLKTVPVHFWSQKCNT
jgi:hypothetical protein